MPQPSCPRCQIKKDQADDSRVSHTGTHFSVKHTGPDRHSRYNNSSCKALRVHRISPIISRGLDCAGQLKNACVSLAKDWRTDKYLRRLEVRFFLLCRYLCLRALLQRSLYGKVSLFRRCRKEERPEFFARFGAVLDFFSPYPRLNLACLFLFARICLWPIIVFNLLSFHASRYAICDVQESSPVGNATL